MRIAYDLSLNEGLSNDEKMPRDIFPKINEYISLPQSHQLFCEWKMNVSFKFSFVSIYLENESYSFVYLLILHY